LETFESYILPGEPIFINPNLVYGYTNYYGDGELKIIDLERGKDVVLTFSNEILHACTSIGILLEFRNENCDSTQFLHVYTH
jgi:hypothetical protein